MERNRTKPQNTRRTKETYMKLEIKKIINQWSQTFTYTCTLDGMRIIVMDYYEPLSVKEILSNFYDYVGLNNATIIAKYNRYRIEGYLVEPYNMKTIYCEDIPNMDYLFRKAEYKKKVRTINDMFQ